MDLALLDPYVPTAPPGQDELPYDDGEPMESPKHRAQMNLLIETLSAWMAGRPDVFIGGNMFLYFSELQTRANDFRGPDFFVVLDALPDRQRKSWVVWQEDGRTPDVVIELLSPRTEAVDRGRKMQIYAGLKVQDYYLFDPDDLRLEGYRLAGSSYERMVSLPDGGLPCRSLGLQLAIAEAEVLDLRGPWLRWRDTDGALLPTERERAAREQARAEAERTRAEAEHERAEAERTRAERLAARLRELGLDPDV